MPHFYNTIERDATAEYKDRGSRFIAYVFPITNAAGFRKRLKALKDEHPKAAHHCFAYRLGTEGTDFRASDDGEPAGTAGKPILGQMDSKNLTNMAVVVVRYFGGTLLGVPGLIAAYKMATTLALQLIPIVQKPVLQFYGLQFDYTQLNEVMLLVKRFGCSIVTQDLQLFCMMTLGVPEAEVALFLEKVRDIHTIQLTKQGT